MPSRNIKKTNKYTEIEKVALNTGVGRFVKEEKMLEQIQNNLSLIAGQKAVPTKAKKAIAGFKIREGMTVGFKVTLRKKRKEDFLVRLINIALPRTRDFRGLDVKSIDKKGNLTLGIKEHIVFPEISADTAKSIFGFEITIVLKYVKNRDKAIEVYRRLGFPFKK